MFSFLYDVLLFLFIFETETQPLKIFANYTSEPCLGLNTTNNSCITCSFNYYPQMAFIQNIIPSNCFQKINETYKQNVYISNQDACTNGICNGSLSNPYTNFFEAMESQMNNIKTFNYSELSFFF